jgi:hypothetical protein
VQGESSMMDGWACHCKPESEPKLPTNQACCHTRVIQLEAMLEHYVGSASTAHPTTHAYHIPPTSTALHHMLHPHINPPTAVLPLAL